MGSHVAGATSHKRGRSHPSDLCSTTFNLYTYDNNGHQPD